MGQKKGGPALSRSLLAYFQAGWQVVFISENRNDSGQVLSGIRIVRFDAPWLKCRFMVHWLGFIARTLWWLYFQGVAFILAVKLNRQYSFSIVYGYEILGIPVARILLRLWRCFPAHALPCAGIGCPTFR